MEKGPAKKVEPVAVKTNPLKYDYYGKHKLSQNMGDLLKADAKVKENEK